MKVQCSLLMLYLLVGLLTLLRISAQSNATALDDVLRDCAFRAFIDPKTGIPYEAMVPENLTGIKITALRLKSGSLYKRGRTYKEFDIPVRTVVTPYVERLALVYQNLGNWSEVYYPLEGYRYLSSVLGIRAYGAGNLSGVKFPELVIKASAKPILISFVDVKLLIPAGAVAKCVWFDLQGGTHFSNATSGNVCSTFELGHFSIVTEAIAPSPAPHGGNPVTGRGKKIKTKTWIIIGSGVGGSVVVLVLIALMVILILKIKRRKQMQRMEKATEAGEAFRTISVGGATRSPSALRTRTAPMIENEYVP